MRIHRNMLSWYAGVSRVKGLLYAVNASNVRTGDVNVTLPPSVVANGTLFAHVCVNVQGSPQDARHPMYNPLHAYCIVHALHRYMLEPKVVKVRCASLIVPGRLYGRSGAQT
jgi:hypothetical protein